MMRLLRLLSLVQTGSRCRIRFFQPAAQLDEMMTLACPPPPPPVGAILEVFAKVKLSAGTPNAPMGIRPLRTSRPPSSPGVPPPPPARNSVLTAIWPKPHVPLVGTRHAGRRQKAPPPPPPHRRHRPPPPKKALQKRKKRQTKKDPPGPSATAALSILRPCLILSDSRVAAAGCKFRLFH